MSDDNVPNSGLPDGLTDERLQAFLLEKWEPRQSRKRQKRLLYKLQRQLQISELWPLASGSEGREGEKVKLLRAVHRIADRLNTEQPPSSEEDWDNRANARLESLLYLSKLSVEELLSPPDHLNSRIYRIDKRVGNTSRLFDDDPIDRHVRKVDAEKRAAYWRYRDGLEA